MAINNDDVEYECKVCKALARWDVVYKYQGCCGFSCIAAYQAVCIKVNLKIDAIRVGSHIIDDGG